MFRIKKDDVDSGQLPPCKFKVPLCFMLCGPIIKNVYGKYILNQKRIPCYEMDKTSIFMFEILEPGGSAFEGSQFYSIGVPKFYSWVNVISVYVYNDLG